MNIEVMNSKIHRVKVTDANLNYVGSITIDEDWMDEVGILTNQQVHVVNITNGERLITYAIPGERGSGVVCLNGAAARKACMAACSWKSVRGESWLGVRMADSAWAGSK